MLLLVLIAAIYLMKLEEAVLTSQDIFFLRSMHDELFELARFLCRVGEELPHQVVVSNNDDRRGLSLPLLRIET
jgi:hypothetical protein